MVDSTTLTPSTHLLVDEQRGQQLHRVDPNLELRVLQQEVHHSQAVAAEQRRQNLRRSQTHKGQAKKSKTCENIRSNIEQTATKQVSFRLTEERRHNSAKQRRARASQPSCNNNENKHRGNKHTTIMTSRPGPTAPQKQNRSPSLFLSLSTARLQTTR